MGAAEHLKALCCLGLPPEAAMVAVVPLLHEIIPHDGARMALVAPDAKITTSYSENPASAAIFRERLWQFMDDPSSLMSLWVPGVRAVAIGWALHRQGGNYLESGYYREIEAPLDSCWLLDAMIGDGGRTIGFVCLTRPRCTRPFTVDDVQRLDGLRPWLAHAFRRCSSPNAHQEDEAPTATAGATILSGQVVLTSVGTDQRRRSSAQNSHGRAKQLHALRPSQRQAARAGSEASPADHRRRERHLQHAASHAGFDRLRRSHARSQMARACGHTCARLRQGPESLSHRGDNRTPRTCHCPCGARAARKRRDAGPDESRNSPCPRQNETCDRGRTRHPTLLGRGSHENALSDSRCSQFRRASHKNLAGPKASRGAPKLAARRISRGLIFNVLAPS
jgi:hypothetical protein